MPRWLLFVCMLFCGALSLLLGGTAMAHSPGLGPPTRIVGQPLDQVQQVPPPSPPPAAVTATAVPQADGGDLQVELTGNGPLVAGETVRFKMAVTNLGPGPSQEAALALDLPAGVVWTSLIGPSGVCSLSGAPGNQAISCAFGGLAVGAIQVLSISGKVTKADCPGIQAAVTVSAANEPSDATANNTAEAAILADCSSDVVVASAAVAPTIDAGDTAGFVLTLTNLGPMAAEGVILTDDLPAAATWTTWTESTLSPDRAGVCSLSGSRGTQSLACEVGDLGVGETWSVTVLGRTSPTSCGELRDVVTVAATNEAADRLTDDTAGATVAVNCPQVSIALTATSEAISAKDAAEFSIVIANAGPGAAHAVRLSDTLPAGVDWQLAGPDAAACAVVYGILACDFGYLSADDTRTVTLSGETSPAHCGDLADAVSIAAENEPADAAADNTASASIAVACPDLAVEQELVTESISVGETASFTIALSNLGRGNAADAGFAVPLPLGMDWHVSGADAAGCAIADGALTCDFGSLGPGEARTITLSAAASTAACGDLTSTVTATDSNEIIGEGGTATDLQILANNMATATVTVGCPAIQVTIEPTDGQGTVIGQAPAGAGITYRYVVTNTGNVPLANVTARDDNATPDNPGDDMALTGCFVASLEPQATVTCSLVHVLPEAATGAENRNVASASGTSPRGEPVTASAEAVLTVNPRPAIGLRTECPSSVTAGQTVGVNVFVSNTGPVEVANLIVTDSVAGALSYVTGDSDADGWLDLDETWTFGGSIVVPGEAASLSRTVAASGIDLNGNPVDVATLPCTTVVQPPS